MNMEYGIIKIKDPFTFLPKSVSIIFLSIILLYNSYLLLKSSTLMILSFATAFAILCEVDFFRAVSNGFRFRALARVDDRIALSLLGG